MTCPECDHPEHLPDCQAELLPADGESEALVCGCMGPRPPTKAELDEAMVWIKSEYGGALRRLGE
jgi:hypothetical protein